MGRRDTRSVVEDVARGYPEQFHDYAMSDIERTTFNVETALGTQPGRDPAELAVVDLGGNFSMFSMVLATLGCRRVTVVDDFSDPINLDNGESMLDQHRALGIEIVQADLVGDLPDALPEADVYTSFDSMEHWHASPKRLFGAVAERTGRGAGFVLGVPNCVNLRKRLTVPLGRGKWSRMEDWYERDVFRGHVREPDVDDLGYIARDMGLTTHRILGRNFQGYYHASAAVRALTPYIDRPLGLFPGLCSDIYLVAPGRGAASPSARAA